MKANRDLVLVVLLFVVLIGFTAALSLRQLQTTEQETSPYSSYASQPNGALALHNWLEALGYRVHREEASLLARSDNAQVLLILPGEEPLTLQESLRVANWVEQGGTLILATSDRLAELGNRDPSEGLLELLDVQMTKVSFANRAYWAQPLLSDVRAPLDVYAQTAIRPGQGQVSYLRPENDAELSLLISFKRGAGTVFVTTAPYLFTNSSLRQDENAALVRGLFRNAQPSQNTTVVFDETHRAVLANDTSANWTSLLYNTAWGQALFLSLLLCFVYLALGGKAFGRPLPLPTETWRRNPAEYALSMAGLYQRANKRRMALQHYRHQLKRRLAKPYGLNADLPDAEFVEALRRTEAADAINMNQLLTTLRQLNAATDSISESQFVALARAATEYS